MIRKLISGFLTVAIVLTIASAVHSAASNPAVYARPKHCARHPVWNHRFQQSEGGMFQWQRYNYHIPAVGSHGYQSTNWTRHKAGA